MRKIPLLLLVFWAVNLSAAQDAKNPQEILIFKGVNNADNKLLPQERGVVEAEECLNFDLSMTRGVLNKPRGYASVMNIKSIDKLRGLFGYRTQNGAAWLFTVYGGTTGYDLIAYSSAGGNDPSPFVYGQDTTAIGLSVNGLYLTLDKTPMWAAWDDNVICANGENRPWRWAGEGWRPLVEVAPGYLDISPSDYNDGATWFLHGDYYYGVRPAEPCSLNAARSWGVVGNISHRVHVDSGSTYIYFFPDGVTTDLCNIDSIIFQICRTRAGRTPYDSMFVIATVSFDNDWMARSAMNIRDSIPDDSLGTVSGAYPYADVWDTVVHEADLSTDTFYHFGQPQWLSTDSSAAGGEGLGAQLDTSLITHHRYGVCWYDSATGAMSPMGEILRIPSAELTAATPLDSVVNLYLPRRTLNKVHLWRILFRAREYEDTVRVPDSTWDDNLLPTEFMNQGGGKADRKQPYCPTGTYLVQIGREWQCKKGYWSFFTANEKHSVVGGFYPVDTIRGADTTYADTLSYVVLEARLGAYSGVILPNRYNDPTIYKNRLFMIEGSNVWYTEPRQFGIFESYIAVNLDDGDENTALHVSGEDLLMFKNRSIHKAEWVGSGYISSEYVSGLGCIAPLSIVNVPGGGYGFLSEKGYYLFTTHLQSQYKESGGNLPNISGPIQNHLDAYDMDDLRECHAWWTPDYKNLCLSFPTLDTTWVYATNGMGWSAWTFAFRQTTRHDTTYQTYTRPSNEVLGIVNYSDSVYRYGNVTLYAGDSITASYKTSPVFKNYRRSVIRHIGVWLTTDTTCTLRAILYDKDGNQVDTVEISTADAYQPYDYKSIDPSGWWQIKLETIADSISIEGLDLWPEWVEDPTGK